MDDLYAMDLGSVENSDMMEGTEATTTVSMDGLLSNWFFVGGVSAGTLLLSVVIGLLLAKSKIKKGFDVYEDQ